MIDTECEELSGFGAWFVADLQTRLIELYFLLQLLVALVHFRRIPVMGPLVNLSSFVERSPFHFFQAGSIPFPLLVMGNLPLQIFP